MSYLGYIKSISECVLKDIAFPKVLEIGIDIGQSAIPLIHNMSNLCDEFLYVGVDIKVKKDFTEQILQMSNISIGEFDDLCNRDVVVFEENSLIWLDKNIDSLMKFDVIFIDGDHNYHTVFNELLLCQNLIHPTSLIVCDDYRGRWSETDLFYSTKEEYKNNKLATKTIKTEKPGVKNAVNDFLINHKDQWSILESEDIGDPCFLYQKNCKFNIVKVPHDKSKIGTLSRTHKILFNTHDIISCQRPQWHLERVSV